VSRRGEQNKDEAKRKIKGLKLCDTITKFFHYKASHCHAKENRITFPQSEMGIATSPNKIEKVVNSHLNAILAHK
jgi:hypothetical protein